MKSPRERDWHLWFAWFPVRDDIRQGWHWLRTLERKFAYGRWVYLKHIPRPSQPIATTNETNP